MGANPHPRPALPLPQGLGFDHEPSHGDAAAAPAFVSAGAGTSSGQQASGGAVIFAAKGAGRAAAGEPAEPSLNAASLVRLALQRKAQADGKLPPGRLGAGSVSPPRQRRASPTYNAFPASTRMSDSPPAQRSESPTYGAGGRRSRSRSRGWVRDRDRSRSREAGGRQQRGSRRERSRSRERRSDRHRRSDRRSRSHSRSRHRGSDSDRRRRSSRDRSPGRHRGGEGDRHRRSSRSPGRHRHGSDTRRRSSRSPGRRSGAAPHEQQQQQPAPAVLAAKAQQQDWEALIPGWVGCRLSAAQTLRSNCPSYYRSPVHSLPALSIHSPAESSRGACRLPPLPLQLCQDEAAREAQGAHPLRPGPSRRHRRPGGRGGGGGSCRPGCRRLAG